MGLPAIFHIPSLAPSSFIQIGQRGGFYIVPTDFSNQLSHQMKQLYLLPFSKI